LHSSRKQMNLIFQGQGHLNTTIGWNNTENSTGGTIYSYSVAILAPNFIAYNNSFQDTLLDVPGKHYFKECFIQGSIDFIFGNGRSLYEICKISLIAKQNRDTTAYARNSASEKTGTSLRSLCYGRLCKNVHIKCHIRLSSWLSADV
ncbi:hypothetical protein GIB67_030382, partial [Kingdonia uniflora]